MDAEIKFSKLSDALPDGFQFYHLGAVETGGEHPAHEPNEVLDFFNDYSVVGFRFEGELRGYLVIIFEKFLEPSTYTEMGNIIASQVATRLSKNEDLHVMISPPQMLNASQFQRLYTSGDPSSVIKRTYFHFNDGRTIPVQTLMFPHLLPMNEETAGNA